MTSRRNKQISFFNLTASLLFFGMFVPQYSYAQQGSLKVNEDSRVERLISKHIELNERMDGIPGYRIQVFFASGSDSRDRANAVKAELLRSRYAQDVYILFEAPYYKVRLGDFRNHLDAERALQDVRLKYPGAFIVEDRIQLPRL